jgi:hypothetical protein
LPRSRSGGLLVAVTAVLLPVLSATGFGAALATRVTLGQVLEVGARVGVLTPLLFGLFPDGRWHPRWFRWAWVGPAAVSTAPLAGPTAVGNSDVVAVAELASWLLSLFSGAVAAQLLGGLAAPQPGRVVLPEFTAREHEILELVARVSPTPRSDDGWRCGPRPCATTSRTCSPRSTPLPERTPCCAPARQGWVRRSRRAVQPDDADRDVLQAATVEVASQLVGFDRGSQPVERTVSIDLAGLRVDGEHDVAVALRELLGGGDEGRVVRNWVVRHRITSWSLSTASTVASA